MTKPLKQPVIHHVVEGNENAPVIVLISGLGGDLRHWQGLRLMLQDQYRVVSLDNRDSGHSERGDGQYYIKDMAIIYPHKAINLYRMHLNGEKIFQFKYGN